jgi:hypothetical protein
MQQLTNKLKSSVGAEDGVVDLITEVEEDGAEVVLTEEVEVGAEDHTVLN